jgi:hypothetical protein
MAIAALLLLSAGTAVALVIHLGGKKEPGAPSAAGAVARAPEARPRPSANPSPPRTEKPDPILPPPPKAVRVPDLPPRPTDPPPPVAPPPPAKPPEAPPAARDGWLPAAEQEAVNKAIDRGVAWLKANQLSNGSWPGFGGTQFHHVGLSALPALTLLECGGSAKDDQIRKAAQHVRTGAPTLDATYDLALCILFLDRLGEDRDRPLIRTLALRLIAGQSETGGWSYRCPIPTPRDEQNMLTILQHHHAEAVLTDSRAEKPDITSTAPESGSGRTPPTSGREPPVTKSVVAKPIEGTRRPSAEEAAKAFDDLPRNLQRVPALHASDTAFAVGGVDQSDHSNTQFAILGVWTARRHGVPMERTLTLIDQRFRKNQRPDGTWGYQLTGAFGSPAMTGAGLLGLAVGLGSAKADGPRDAGAAPARDAAVEKGLLALAETIGKPLDASPFRPADLANVSLYFLWTVERVGVLYNLRTIGGKDWYQWGSQILVEKQLEEGDWDIRGYPGALPPVDTCFALLFLKRSNLVQDLTKRLEFSIDAKALERSR